MADESFGKSMITERDKRLAELRADATAGDLPDILWLLDEIDRLDKALGVRNDLQARVARLESKMEEIHPTLT